MNHAAATVLMATVGDPSGYGRIIRGSDGGRSIIEHTDASAEQLAINEINTSVFAFEAGELARALTGLGRTNAQSEKYLTDVIGMIAEAGGRVGAVEVIAEEASGVNSQAELASAAYSLRKRIDTYWMDAGVWMEDPERVYIDAAAVLSAGTKIYPDVHLKGRTSVAEGAIVGPGVFAVDSRIGPGTRVSYSVLTSVVVGAGAIIGPYAHLRPGSALGDDTKVGSFVKTKAATIGAGTRVAHLAYVGDAEIGEEANIGSGAVTVNYDGFAKHRTVIGDRARIGSATMLVAPLEIGDDAFTAAGSVITKNVPPGALGVERSPQRQVPGYATRRQHRANREPS